ncbi:Acriflavin resistance protein [Thermogutta terrifontis]|uniref:Acriflavin resistance protein n=1 Tax=Thermogutta terrifontis TaxID=1331910 RepID=A0A286RDL3_9BACT|nr:efflux RND transporter permease subunit [Thermogutta terrifontis]ASV74037.1 Acriflavin resistance protein [Thermogutta terrifontis]
MKSILRWSIRNSPAMNTLLIGIVVVGLLSLFRMRREVFPEFNLDMILITVPYPGASPTEVEEGICQKIEEAVRSVAGVKKTYGVAREGAGSVILELRSDVADPQRVLDEVRSEVDRIPSFPELAEKPEVRLITFRRAAITVGVIGPDSDDPRAERALRELAEKVRDELVALPNVNQADLMGVRPYEISIEIPEHVLRKYGLTLQQVAQIIRRENIEVPGGTLRSHAQEVLLRGKNKGLTGKEIAEIPLITSPDGTILRLGDVATVRDAFADTTAFSRINGHPGMAIVVSSTSDEDIIKTTHDVHEYVARKKLPPGYQLVTWGDFSTYVRDRLNLLARNGLQGLIIVFVLLAIFLEIHLAFWVALGIPIAMLGTAIIMQWSDQTLNMMSMFAFLMALGMLVDDAIVIGENVYVHRQMGKNYIQAAVDGTAEVIPSVTTSVMTTVIAFAPLFFVPGIMGKFVWLLPFGVITMLLVSLAEAIFVLPCHLAHDPRHRRERERRLMELEDSADEQAAGGDVPVIRGRRRRWLVLLWRMASVVLMAAVLMFLASGTVPGEIAWIVWTAIVLAVGIPLLGLYLPAIEKFTNAVNFYADSVLQRFIDRVYTPVLKLALRFAPVSFSVALAALITALGLVASGLVPFIPFPKLDSESLEANVYYPAGTPEEVTKRATAAMEEAIWEIDREWRDKGIPLVKTVYRVVGETSAGALRIGNELPTGSHSGKLEVELVNAEQRPVTSEVIVKLWRERAMKLGRNFPGAESVTFQSQSRGPGGAPIEFRLLAPVHKMQELEEVVEKCKAYLAQVPGVFDIQDDARAGKWEFQIKTNDKAKALGVTLADLAGTIRAAYYGEEAMRLQRGRHEVKVMVRYPEDERRSLAHFEDIRIRAGNVERPITELAQINIQRGYSQINRMDQLRAIAITADVDEAVVNSQKIVEELKSKVIPQLLADPRYSEIQVRWEGAQEQTNESIQAMIWGLLVALVAMFALLTLEFRSYFQPIIILLIIPFGLVGAIVGHVVMGMPLTLMSIFGMVALTGVVVNDSIVLVDFINMRVENGMSVKEAIVDAGRRRLRPIMLTSVTTIGGLAPLVFERSAQAQFLIPMAVTICFGLAFTTVLCLLLVPVVYLLYSWIMPVRVIEELPEEAVPRGAESERILQREPESERAAIVESAFSMEEPAETSEPLNAPRSF